MRSLPRIANYFYFLYLSRAIPFDLLKYSYIDISTNSTLGKMLGSISNCTKIPLLQFTDQIAKHRNNRGN